MDKAALLSKYEANLANSKGRAHYLSYAEAFLEHANDLTRESVDAYIALLRKKGRRPGTINFAFRVVKRLFSVNGLPWEYRHGEAPAIGQRDEYRPQLSPQVVGMMIAAAKNGKLYPDECVFLACSTIYGLRREEMVNLRPPDVNLKSRSIYIATVKFGRERYHMIPPAILPYLKAHKFSDSYGLATLSQMFHRILIKSGLKELNERRLGWHAIRRSVFDGLINAGVNPMAARSFLRWKSASGDMAMPARYYGNVVIGLNGSEPVLEEAKGDEEIFEKHPFVPLWIPTVKEG